MILMSEDVLMATNTLRDFLYQNVYYNSLTRAEFEKASKIIKELYFYYLTHTEQILVEEPQ